MSIQCDQKPLPQMYGLVARFREPMPSYSNVRSKQPTVSANVLQDTDETRTTAPDVDLNKCHRNASESFETSTSMVTGESACKSDSNVYSDSRDSIDSWYNSDCSDGGGYGSSEIPLLNHGYFDLVRRFSHRGGELSKPGSDVTLYIPKNAIPRGNAVSVRGNVYTRLSAFVSAFKLKEDESFISPVATFTHDQPTAWKFMRHLQLKIPVAYPCASGSSVRVLCSSGNGDGTVTQVPFMDSMPSNPPDMYYDVKGDGFVYVYTKHFSKYVVVTSEVKILSLFSIVFGQCYPAGEKVEANIRLYIGDLLFSIKDFRKEVEEMEQGRKPIHQKYIQLSKEPDLQDKITTKLDLSMDARQEWTTKLRSDKTPVFKQPKITIGDLVPTSARGQLPPKLIEWMFVTTDGEPVAPFECVLDIDHVSASSQKTRTTFNISLNITYKKEKNNQLTIENLSDQLFLPEATTLARWLGLEHAAVEHIKANNQGDSRETIKQLLFKCLHHRGGEHFHKSLPESLRRIERVDLAEEMETYERMVTSGPFSTQVTRAGAQQPSVPVGGKRRLTGDGKTNPSNNGRASPEQQSTAAEKAGQAALIKPCGVDEQAISSRYNLRKKTRTN